MSITYPPEMLPRADDPATVMVCSNSECCLRAENERLRAALKAVTEFAAEYAGGVNSDLGDVEQWEPMKQARAELATP